MTERGREPAGAEPDRPDMRDATNDSPYLQGEGSTTGLGGVGNETAGGGLGPDFAGGTVPPEITAGHPGMSNAGPASGAAGGDTRTRGASSHSVGGPGTAGPGSDVTESESDHLQTGGSGRQRDADERA